MVLDGIFMVLCGILRDFNGVNRVFHGFSWFVLYLLIALVVFLWINIVGVVQSVYNSLEQVPEILLKSMKS